MNMKNIDRDISNGFDAGNYANAYETQDYEHALAKLSMNRTSEYVAAFTLGFFSSYELDEMGEHGEPTITSANLPGSPRPSLSMVTYGNIWSRALRHDAPALAGAFFFLRPELRVLLWGVEVVVMKVEQLKWCDSEGVRVGFVFFAPGERHECEAHDRNGTRGYSAALAIVTESDTVRHPADWPRSEVGQRELARPNFPTCG